MLLSRDNESLTARAADLNLLWPLGLIFGALFLFEFVLVLSTANVVVQGRMHWAEFISVGLVLPPILWLLRPQKGQRGLAGEMRLGLALFVAAWIWVQAISEGRLQLVIPFLAEYAILALAGFFRDLDWIDSIGIMFAGALAWLCVVPLSPPARIAAAGLSLPTIVYCTAFVLFVVAFARHSSKLLDLRWRIVAAVIAAPLFALFAFRNDDLFASVGVTYHQWFWAGPALIARHGGWLLWDTPSQYGFLNILSIAAMPGSTTWQAMYVDTAVLLLAEALLLFGILAARRLTAWNLCIAVALPLATILITPDTAPRLQAIVGPLRFFWSMAMIAVVVLIYLAKSAAARRRLTWLGAACWIVGCLWSAESALYSTCAWIPAYAMSVFFDHPDDVAVWRRLGSAFARGIAMLALIPATMLATCAVYWLAIRHFPDWRALVEYGLLYAVGTSTAAPAGLHIANGMGPIILIVFVLGLLFSAAVACGREGRWRALPVLAASFGSLWAVASYYVMRSADGNVVGLFATTMFAVAVVLLVVDREELDVRSVRFLLAAALPVILATCSIEFANESTAEAVLPGMAHFEFDVAARAPKLYDAVATLLHRNHLEPSTRLLVEGGDPQLHLARAADGSSFQPVPWLPEDPPWLMAALPPARQDEYLRRYLARNPAHGWVLTADRQDSTACDQIVPGSAPVLRDAIDSWALWYCAGDAPIAPVSLPFGFRNTEGSIAGVLSEFQAQGILSHGGPTRWPVLAAPGGALTVRGWAAPLVGHVELSGVEALVDGESIDQRVLFGPRPDLSARAGQPFVAGYAITISTRGLPAGPHRLSLVALDSRGRAAENLVTGIPFGIYAISTH